MLLISKVFHSFPNQPLPLLVPPSSVLWSGFGETVDEADGMKSVLNPSNTTASPIPTATSQAVAFAGVSSASNVPFTSGISATTTAPSASTMTAAAYGGMPSGAVGMAALFGAGAAVVVGF